jgi:amidase
MERLHTFTDDALGADDAVGLVERLRAGDVSASELVEAAIARVAAVDPQLGAVAVEDHDRARSAASAPGHGFFAGVPTFLKDNVDVAGLPTQEGTDAFVAPPARTDGDVARLFRALGPVVLGKTRLSEFGFSGACDHPRQGPVRNPWNPDHYAGASSSGSGALVGAGAVPFAHGNDGGGSIRIPASANGLVGLKPTRGRVPSEALTRQMPVRLVADGVLTRTVRDTAAFLREAERVYRDPSLPPVGVEKLTLETATRLEGLGHHVERIDIPVPDAFADAFLTYWAMLAGFMVATGRREHGDSWNPANLDNLTLGLARFARRRAWAIPSATALLARSQVASRRLYAKYDVTLTPTVAHETPKVGHLDPTAAYEQVNRRLLDWVAFTPLQNATGDPAISLPLALTQSGLPHGMHFSAGRGQDALLLQLALQLEGEWGFTSITA